MSSVDVLKKESKCFTRKKSKCPKKKNSKCEEGEMFKYRISGVRKKMKEKFGEKIFGWKFC